MTRADPLAPGPLANDDYARGYGDGLAMLAQSELSVDYSDGYELGWFAAHRSHPGLIVVKSGIHRKYRCDQCANGFEYYDRKR